MRRVLGFRSKRAFEQWHQRALKELGYPRPAINAATGEPMQTSSSIMPTEPMVDDESEPGEDAVLVEMDTDSLSQGLRPGGEHARQARELTPRQLRRRRRRKQERINKRNPDNEGRGGRGGGGRGRP